MPFWLRKTARRISFSGSTLIVLALAGCKIGPTFVPPRQDEAAKPWAPRAGHFEAQPIASHVVPEPTEASWWSSFNDSVLTSLEQRVAANNLDVQTATVRLAESRAQLGGTRAALFPSLNGAASYQRLKPVSDRSLQVGLGKAGLNGLLAESGQKIEVPPIDYFRYGIDASWEIDLWGRVRRHIEAGEAQIQQNQEARRATLVSAMAEVALDYMRLRNVQADIDIVRRNAEVARQNLNLARQRQTGGLGSDLDVQNARAQLALTESALPALETQQTALINALSLLLGQAPQALSGELIVPRPVPPVPPRVPVGLPSDLVRRRPDVRQAEATLHEATANIGVAEASFLPRVIINANLMMSALTFADMGNWGSNTYGIGPMITLPIFEGGRLKANLDMATQQQKEAAIAYRKTVLQAFHDVSNAMAAYEDEQRRNEALRQSVDADRRAVGLAQNAYRNGLVTFLDVLNAERQLLAAERDLADSDAAISTNLVQLYKALGGGWENDAPVPLPTPVGNASSPVKAQ
ncbi:Type I secretion outer membrane protein [Granulibacter bethesdensis]|uniref:Type I secretion outer membrane protein n=1 Tax=Granulibacter bethesdensis TaxID=364410 RepID=A0AAN0VGB2_9PROT|nr:efflux transporter outer membrane subunit [Granulibacter bethesdensis]AHJ63347.1 Type I secretion outer membrane protein [Granulibacter bethesdensis]